MKRLDLKPDTVYLLVPWRGNAATYNGPGAYARTTPELETVKERTSSWGGRTSGGRTLIAMLPVEPAEHDGYTVPQLDGEKQEDVAPARVICEVCPVADWPKYLERLAGQHRERTVNADAAVLKRREAVEQLLALELRTPGPIPGDWWAFVSFVAGMNDERRRRIARMLYDAALRPPLEPARALIASIVAGNRSSDYRAHQIIGTLSTEGADD